MEPLLVLGPLSITPYSLMIFSGAVIGTLLAARKKTVRPALPLTALLALILGHVVWCLMNDTSMEYYGSSLLFQPWRGGYTLYGALLGGFLGALITARLTRVRLTEITDGLAAGAAALLFFARMGEYFSGQGCGAVLENEGLHFFPLAYIPWGETAESADWCYAVWFWEAAAALVLLAVLLLRRPSRRGDPTFIFLSVLGLTQIFFEQLRRDDYVSLTGFVRFSQVGALVSLIAVMITLTVLRRPKTLTAVFCFLTLAAASLTIMYVEFALDKTRYYPILYISTAATAVITVCLLIISGGRKGLASAGWAGLSAFILLFSHALEDPEANSYVILYGFMVWALACIGAAVSLLMKSRPGEAKNLPGETETLSGEVRR